MAAWSDNVLNQFDNENRWHHSHAASFPLAVQCSVIKMPTWTGIHIALPRQRCNYYLSTRFTAEGVKLNCTAKVNSMQVSSHRLYRRLRDFCFISKGPNLVAWAWWTLLEIDSTFTYIRSITELRHDTISPWQQLLRCDPVSQANTSLLRLGDFEE